MLAHVNCVFLLVTLHNPQYTGSSLFCLLWFTNFSLNYYRTFHPLHSTTLIHYVKKWYNISHSFSMMT